MPVARGRSAVLLSVAALVVLTIAAAGVSIALSAHSMHSTQSADPAASAQRTAPLAHRAPPPSLSTLSICGTPGRLTGLTVTRTDPFPGNRVAFSFPVQVASSDAPAIAALARTMCGLALFPTGTLYCPADLGITYLMMFTAGPRPVGAITAAPGGCPRLTGLGAPRWPSPTFWDQLAAALGLPYLHQDCDPFAGQLPNEITPCGAFPAVRMR